jgi:hypothetical protein
MDPCPICQDDQDDHEPGDCLVGLDPSPGDDRRAYVKALTMFWRVKEERPGREQHRGV